MRHASKRLDARVANRNAQNHHQWWTVPPAKSEVNAGMANVYHTVKLRACRVVCAISFRMHANDAVE